MADFSSLFAQVPRPLTRRLAWVELAANVVLPAGGVSGLTLAVWVLRRQGPAIAAIARTSAAVFAITSFPNFVAVALVGGVMASRALWRFTRCDDDTGCLPFVEGKRKEQRNVYDDSRQAAAAI